MKPQNVAVSTIALSSAGDRIAYAGMSRSPFGDSVEYSDTQLRQSHVVVAGAIDSIQCVCLSPDGTIVAAGDSDGHVRIWTIAK
jgi:WD40 repeat protein